MAILMRTSVQGMTAEQGKGFIAQVQDKMATYPGFIAHASGPTEDSYYVIELWESREAHERWVHEVIEPMMRQAGASGAPPAEYQQVDNVVTR